MRSILIAAVTAALLAGVTACGGGSGSSNSTSTTTTTAGSTTTAGGGAGGRLSAADWATYQQTAAEAKSVNDKAMKQFRTCRTLANTQPSKAQTCFEDSTSSVVKGGQKVLGVVQDLQTRSGGACSQALLRVYSDVKLYISAVNALNLNAQHGTIPTQANVDAAIGQLKDARTSAAAVAPVCQPK